MPTCPHPDCTGVHDNNRFSELCPRSRAAKRIKDMRYVYNDTVTQGLTTKGFTVRLHRENMAFIRRCIRRYGPGSEYAGMFGEDRNEVSYWQGRLAEELDRFQARREGHRATRRKIGIICMGPKGLVTEQMMIVATRNLDVRTYYG